MGLHTFLLALQIAAPDSARLAALARFHPGTTLRLQGSAIGLVEAKLRLPLGDSITTGRWQPNRRIPLAAVDSIWVLHSGVDKGVVVGGLAFGVVFGVIGAGLSSLDDDSSDVTNGIIAGAGFGVALGSLLGAIVGAGNQFWERIYP
jgi:hypothetical protein